MVLIGYRYFLFWKSTFNDEIENNFSLQRKRWDEQIGVKILFEVIQKLVSNGLGFLALLTNVAHFHLISSFFTVKMLLALHCTFKLYTLAMHAAVFALFSPLPFSNAICSFISMFLPQVRNRGAVLDPTRKHATFLNFNNILKSLRNARNSLDYKFIV